MPEQEFSFRDLIKPGEGVKLAMQRELEKRKAADDERWKWEPGYVYSGAADLLLKHGEFFNGRQLPDKYERGPEQRCFENALELAEADPSLRYFQGLYMVAGTACAHAWCVDDEGVIEVTFWTVGQDPHTGAKVVIRPHGGGTGSLPWSPPATWGYWGVEFDPAWAREFMEVHQGEECSILDPRHHDEAAHGWAPLDDWIFRRAYSRAPGDIPPYTPPPKPDFDDDEDWDDEEDDDE